jgi:uncharacterized protein (DUF1697 family)
LGHLQVETFIASGNVLFASKSRSGAAIERRIEAALEETLGYQVATFVRTASELAEVATRLPFDGWEDDSAASRYIAFVRVAPARGFDKKLSPVATPDDQFHVAGREVYWLGRAKLSEAKFNGAVLEKTLAAPATLRNVTTVRKIAALLDAR